jgi:hypothetical protein
VIVGSAGDDFIDGLGGDDRILGGDGVEFVAGDNVTYGDAIGGSDDYIDGGAGVEFLWGDNLVVRGGTAFGGRRRHRWRGRDDRLFGDNTDNGWTASLLTVGGSDKPNGGAGNDVLPARSRR